MDDLDPLNDQLMYKNKFLQFQVSWHEIRFFCKKIDQWLQCYFLCEKTFFWLWWPIRITTRVQMAKTLSQAFIHRTLFFYSNELTKHFDYYFSFLLYEYFREKNQEIIFDRNNQKHSRGVYHWKALWILNKTFLYDIFIFPTIKSYGHFKY